jgi:cytochrome c-type biogenesis protein CcmH/NrfG
LGAAYGESNQPDKAISAYREAVRLDPEHADAWGNLGAAYTGAQQLDKAIEALQQALRIEPGRIKSLFLLGVCYGETKQRDKMLEVYRQLKARSEPKHAEIIFKRYISQ